MTPTMTREARVNRFGTPIPPPQPRGARLPQGPKAVPIACYRCEEDRRKLTPVRLVAGGITLGTTQVCGPCIEALTPLDPDPLTVDEALA